MREVSASEQQGVVAWEHDGIPIETAERVIQDRTLAYRVTADNRQPFGLRYFDAAVRRAWQLEQQPKGTAKSPLDEYDLARLKFAEEERRAG